MSEEQREELYTREDIARLAKVTLRTVTRWITSGQLPAVKISGMTRIRCSDWEAFQRPFKVKVG